MIVLGIESSHDDTSIAIVENYKVLFNYKISQIEIHKQHGGTIPEIASREHYNSFYVLLEKIKKNFDLSRIDYVAYTKEPGLIGSLHMGYLFAHAVSLNLNKPIIGINHLEGHLYSTQLFNKEEEKQEIKYPSIGLVVSGGHTNLYLLKSPDNILLIGQTLDDAAGEVYDKVSRTLNLGFPGGPEIDKIFFQQNKNKNKEAYNFSSPKTKNELDFSFSGYKTQIINYVNKNGLKNKDFIAYSFQKNVIDYVISKVNLSIKKYDPKSILLSGGVSANKYLRESFLNLHKNAFIPILEYTTDNGAMVAARAISMLCNK